MRKFILVATALVSVAGLGAPAWAQSALSQSPQMPAGYVPVGQGVPNAAPAPQSGPQAYVPPPQQYPAGAPAPGAYPAPSGGAPAGYPYTPGTQAVVPPSPADAAFAAALLGTQPLTDAQAQTFRDKERRFESIRGQPFDGPAKPVSRSVMLSLRAGEVAPTLHLAPGNATVLTFYDETGAAWPVMSVTVGNPTAYSAQEAGDKGKTNMVVISPISNFADANLVVTLVDYPVPVLFSLVTGDGTVDYRLDVGITSRGPNAQYDIAQGSDLEPTNDPTMQSFVDGLPPKGSVKIDTTNPDVEAWRLGDMDYIRTPLELLSPAFIGRQMHPSGIKVYSITDTPVLMFSQDGRMTMVELDR